MCFPAPRALRCLPAESGHGLRLQLQPHIQRSGSVVASHVSVVGGRCVEIQGRPACLWDGAVTSTESWAHAPPPARQREVSGSRLLQVYKGGGDRSFQHCLEAQRCTVFVV